MANLTNCHLCGERVRWYETRCIGDKTVCNYCEQNLLDCYLDTSYDDLAAIVRAAQIHAPLDIHGKPMFVGMGGIIR